MGRNSLNTLEEVSPERRFWIDLVENTEFTQIQEELENIVSFLLGTVSDERSLSIIKKRYFGKKTLKQISQEESLSSIESVRQLINNEFRQMRKLECMPYLKMGYSLNMAQRLVEIKKEAEEYKIKCNASLSLMSLRGSLVDNEKEDWDKLLSISIDDLNLSMISYNLLKRKGISTIKDIKDFGLINLLSKEIDFSRVAEIDDSLKMVGVILPWEDKK